MNTYILKTFLYSSNYSLEYSGRLILVSEIPLGRENMLMPIARAARTQTSHRLGNIRHLDKEGQYKSTHGELIMWLHRGNLLGNQELGVPDVCLFLLKLRFLILNRRQCSRIGKTNSWDWRSSLQLSTSDLWFNQWNWFLLVKWNYCTRSVVLMKVYTTWLLCLWLQEVHRITELQQRSADLWTLNYMTYNFSLPSSKIFWLYEACALEPQGCFLVVCELLWVRHLWLLWAD